MFTDPYYMFTDPYYVFPDPDRVFAEADAWPSGVPISCSVC